MAFDCIPLVGEVLGEGDSSEERRLVRVLRRLLNQPDLPIDVTRVRVPVFGGSMACVHLTLAGELPVDAACGLWEKLPQLEVLAKEELPSLRRVIGRDSVHLGRIRLGAEEPRRLSFVLAMDDLRYGSALAAVLAAETLCRIH